MIEKKLKQFQSYSDLKIFIIFLLIGILLSFLGTLLSEIWDSQLVDNTTEQYSKVKLLVMGVIMAPIFETLLFFYLPFHLLKNHLKPKYIISISAFLFGIQHFYSVDYIIFGIMLGWLFALYYLHYLYNKNKAFLLLSLLHATINFITISLSFLG